MAYMQGYAAKTTEDSYGSGVAINFKGTRSGDLFAADYLYHLVMRGKGFFVSGAAVNTTLTAQTSFADTTPSQLLSVPSGTTAILLSVKEVQTGSVANAVVDAHLASSGNVDAYASSGSAVTNVANMRADLTPTGSTGTNTCTFRTGATATASKLIYALHSWHVGQDVSSAEGADNGLYWTWQKFGYPFFAVGPTSVGFFSYVGTTAPTYYYHWAWIEIPSTEVTG